MDKYVISEGARFFIQYRITTTDTGSLEGTYRGMAAMGTETALVFETSDGVSFILSNSVVRMDQLEAAPEEPKRDVAQDRALYG